MSLFCIWIHNIDCPDFQNKGQKNSLFLGKGKTICFFDVVVAWSNAFTLYKYMVDMQFIYYLLFTNLHECA